MHGIGQNIKSRLRVRCPSNVQCPSGVSGQDCAVIYGPIFTKFATWLSCIIEMKRFLSNSI